MTTEPLSFWSRLRKAANQKETLLCVGIDPSLDKIPSDYLRDHKGLFSYCSDLIDAIHEHCCAIKFQFAHFAAIGAESVLAELFLKVHSVYPDLLLILDSKRGDVPSTSFYYAQESFERYAADAVTAHPFLGIDALAPFFSYDQGKKGVFVLCRTSNPGAEALQDLKLENGGISLSEKVADIFSEAYSPYKVGFVIGATYLDMMSRLRTKYPQTWFLIPGIGAQGGKLEDVLLASSMSSSQIENNYSLFSVSRHITELDNDCSVKSAGRRAQHFTKNLRDTFLDITSIHK